jgi:hypothetical protein
MKAGNEILVTGSLTKKAHKRIQQLGISIRMFVEAAVNAMLGFENEHILFMFITNNTPVVLFKPKDDDLVAFTTSEVTDREEALINAMVNMANKHTDWKQFVRDHCAKTGMILLG